MSTEQSRFIPQNQFWYEDLVAREAPLTEGENAGHPLVGEDLNHVDDNYLEVSRESTLIRGGQILGGVIGLIFAIYVGPDLIDASS